MEERGKNAILEGLIQWNVKMQEQFQKNGDKEKLKEIEKGLKELKQEQMRIKQDYLFEQLDLETTYIAEGEKLKICKDDTGINASVYFSPYGFEVDKMESKLEKIQGKRQKIKGKQFTNNKESVRKPFEIKLEIDGTYRNKLMTYEEIKEVLPANVMQKFLENIALYSGEDTALLDKIGLKKGVDDLKLQQNNVNEGNEPKEEIVDKFLRIDITAHTDIDFVDEKLTNWGIKKDAKGYYTDDPQKYQQVTQWLLKRLERQESNTKNQEVKGGTDKQLKFAKNIAEGFKLELPQEILDDADKIDKFIQKHVVAFYHLVKGVELTNIPKNYQTYMNQYDPNNYSEFMGMKSLDIQPKKQQSIPKNNRVGQNKRKSNNQEQEKGKTYEER